MQPSYRLRQTSRTNIVSATRIQNGIEELKLARQELLPGWAPFLACRSGPATELWAALGRPNAGSTTETYGILQVVMFRVDVGGEPQTPVSLPGATKRWKSPEQHAPGATL